MAWTRRPSSKAGRFEQFGLALLHGHAALCVLFVAIHGLAIFYHASRGVRGE